VQLVHQTCDRYAQETHAIATHKKHRRAVISISSSHLLNRLPFASRSQCRFPLANYNPPAVRAMTGFSVVNTIKAQLLPRSAVGEF